MCPECRRHTVLSMYQIPREQWGMDHQEADCDHCGTHLIRDFGVEAFAWRAAA